MVDRIKKEVLKLEKYTDEPMSLETVYDLKPVLRDILKVTYDVISECDGVIREYEMNRVKVCGCCGWNMVNSAMNVSGKLYTCNRGTCHSKCKACIAPIIFFSDDM